MYTTLFACIALLGRMSNAVPMEHHPVVDQEILLESPQAGPLDPFSNIETADEDLSQAILLDATVPAFNKNEDSLSINDLSRYLESRIVGGTDELDQMSDEDLSQAILLDAPSPAINKINKGSLSTDDLSQYFESRIVGGSDAKPYYAPYMVALIIGWDWPSFMCGGSVITKNHVLTAAHCIVYDMQGQVLRSFHGRVGTNSWNNGGIIVIFSCHKNHPDYDFFTIKNDVGVLFLENSLTFSASISPIALNSHWVDGGVSAHVTGWGRTSLGGILPTYLQILHIWTLSPKECEKKWSEIASTWSPIVDHKQEICTFHSRNHGMCHGDSGSALVCRKTRKQIGVVSWGFPCAIDGPDVFVRISNFIKFIQAVIKEKCSKK